MLERLKPASVNQPLMAEPVMTQGNPLATPKQKILSNLRSLK